MNDRPQRSTFLRILAIAMVLGGLLGVTCNPIVNAMSGTDDPPTDGEALLNGAMVGLIFGFIPAALAAGVVDLARGRAGKPADQAADRAIPGNQDPARPAPVQVVSGAAVSNSSAWWRHARRWGLIMLVYVYFFFGVANVLLAGSPLPSVVGFLLVASAAFSGRRFLQDVGEAIKLGLWAGGVAIVSVLVLRSLDLQAEEAGRIRPGDVVMSLLPRAVAVLSASALGAWLGGVRWTSRGFISS